ncbi:hypothetical protein [Halobacillus mangrovi]|uniref:hypothetical protein n=1 Tax=Halobacillus mangrovi TaxID=402384 RepID=UPI003D99D1B8
MNDLLAHKLKKIDKKVKQDKVSFDKEHTHKAVIARMHKPNGSNQLRVSLMISLPAIALVTFFCLQILDTHSGTPIHTASMHPEKTMAFVAKTAAFHDGTLDKKSFTSTEASSTMIRETYVIHNNEHFVQTGELVNPEELNEILGLVKNEDSAEELALRRNSSSFFPEAKIYSIKGRDKNEMIAIQSTRSTGIGSSSISNQGYFVFKKRNIKAAQ